MSHARLPVDRPSLLVLLLVVLIATSASAQLPPEVASAVFGDDTTLEWDSATGADFYNVYRGRLDQLTLGGLSRCHGFEVAGTSFSTPDAPASGSGYFYLITGESALDGEGTAGWSSSGHPRQLLAACTPMMQAHVLNRLGYGWGEWSIDRIRTLGVQAYIDEQLDPASIDESTNLELTSGLQFIDPPADIFQLVQHQVIRATFARRQLEQQAAAFWANHFNTFWQKNAQIFQSIYPACLVPPAPQCDPGFPAVAWETATHLQYDDIERFRDLAFNGNFRTMVEESGLSLAMIIFLDTYTSVAGAPNENYPRELMELHAMGVGGGYTQLDVEELSRVITGWSGCKKRITNLGPLDPCISDYWNPNPPGKWVAHFVTANHDCTAKTLFAGTPQEVTIPDTCATPEQGLADLGLALDGIVAHPATSQFIATKLLQRFITDTPSQEMIDFVVAEWNDPTNPQGVGDLREVLRAVLDPSLLLDPVNVSSKIKTPIEYAVGALRSTRGRTDGVTEVLNFLNSTSQIPHFNPVPTGWPEDGDSWLDTNNLLDRQNFATAMLSSGDPVFGADPLQLLTDNGISTAPGNSEAIVDFFATAMFGGKWTPAERQAAIDYLDTDSAGTPSPYSATRILETVLLLLGYPHFQEQ